MCVGNKRGEARRSQGVYNAYRDKPPQNTAGIIRPFAVRYPHSSTMHSSLNRAQSVFGFFTTVALVVAGLAALSVLLFPTEATTASVQLKNVQV